MGRVGEPQGGGQDPEDPDAVRTLRHGPGPFQIGKDG